jgi:hypothetical protein
MVGLILATYPLGEFGFEGVLFGVVAGVFAVPMFVGAGLGLLGRASGLWMLKFGSILLGSLGDFSFVERVWNIEFDPAYKEYMARPWRETGG